MKDKLLIIGASGHGKVIADIAMKMNLWRNIAFFDDDTSKKVCMDLKVIGKVDEAYSYPEDADFFVALGDNKLREEIQEKLIFEKKTVAKLIHPNAVIGTDVEIGIGTVIMAGVVINSSTLVGKGCIINTSSSLDHDNILEDYIHISPGVKTAGNVKIGKGTWLGIGSVVINNVDICNEITIGAGAVVLKDILKPGTYVGIQVRRVN